MKTKIFAFLEILLVYAVVQAIGVLRRSTGMVQWEVEHLGWSYTGMLFFVGIPALVVWLFRRDWKEYGVSLENWRTNLDTGIKAYLVRFIPLGLGWAGTRLLGIDSNRLPGGIFITVLEIIALGIMVWVLSRQNPVTSARNNIILTIVLLLFPIGVGLAVGRLSLVVVSTVIWQFVLSGFGEEFAWRGYAQTRLNQAFGRPFDFYGIHFGPGMVIAAFFFGMFHAFNTYNPAIGFTSLSWGWALSSFAAGLFFGVIREKTGTLLAPGIAHGLPDAVGEPLMKIFDWM